MSAWAQLKVKNALPSHPRDVAFVTDSTSVEETLKLLNKHNILGALVFTNEDPPKLHGIIDVLDILQFLINTKEKNVHSAYQQQRQFNLAHVRGVVDLSGRDPCTPLSVDSPLIDALRLFAAGVHRVPIVDPGQEKITNMLSQSDMLRFLHANPQLLSSINDKTVAELSLGSVEDKSSEVIKVDKKTPALDAFKLILKHKLSAVAVTGDDGKIVAQVSASDLRALTGEIEAPLNVMSLLLPTYEFVARVRKFRNNEQNFLVWCQPSSQFKNVIPLAIENRVHRVMVIDNYVNLTGVIALTDIAKCVIAHCL